MTKIVDKTKQYGPFMVSKPNGEEVFKFEIPADELYHSSRLTILDSRFGGSARITSEPAKGHTGKGELVVAWNCEGNSDVKFQVEAFTSPKNPKPTDPSPTQQMTGFLPSKHGWPFDNWFEAVPPFKLIGDLRYGDASRGLCGGMVFAAIDYYKAGKELPKIPQKDISTRYGSPLHGPIFDYLGNRLFDSFNIPVGVLNYIELMHPNFPDFQTSKAIIGLTPRNRAWRMVRQEWPEIKARLDKGEPSPLGLVRIKSTKLSELGKNHQVLAYGYDVKGDELTLFIYDPNFHHNDSVTLKLDIGNPERKVNVTYSDHNPVYCFFYTNYAPVKPPKI